MDARSNVSPALGSSADRGATVFSVIIAISFPPPAQRHDAVAAAGDPPEPRSPGGCVNLQERYGGFAQF
jgi:hypothetical protein